MKNKFIKQEYILDRNSFRSIVLVRTFNNNKIDYHHIYIHHYSPVVSIISTAYNELFMIQEQFRGYFIDIRIVNFINILNDYLTYLKNIIKKENIIYNQEEFAFRFNKEYIIDEFRLSNNLLRKRYEIKTNNNSINFCFNKSYKQIIDFITNFIDNMQVTIDFKK